MDRSEEQRLSRRHFLAAAGLAGGALAASQSKLFAQESPATAPATQSAGFAKVPFGKTGLATTLVGFGAIRLDDPAMGARLLKMAIDAGVNVVHTARGYTGGKSVLSIARLYEQDPTYRKKAFLFLKENDKVSEEALDRDLKNLNTDYVDAYLPQLQKPEAETMEKALAALDALKKKGKIRFGGFTCHDDMNGVMELIMEKAPKGYDCCLISTAPLRPASGKAAQDQQALRFTMNLKRLGEHVGIISMKSGASKVVGNGPEAYGAHMRVLAAAGVDTCITSFASVKTIENAINAGLSTLTPATTADAAQWRQQWQAEGWPCLMCGQCSGACPAGLPVASLMRMVMYRDHYHMGRHAKQEFAEMNLDAASVMRSCDGCTACTGACPMGLASADRVRDIVGSLA
jgi:predicted aldo/keto reductase-like oxidoreductase